MDSTKINDLEARDKTSDSNLNGASNRARRVYKYKRSKRSIYLTILMLILGVAVFLYFFTTSSGTYLSAWYLSLAIAVLLLFILSFPRYIKLSSNSIDINCILEVSSIPYSDIVRVCKIRRYVVNYHIPIMGSYGFGGYFGYYLNLKQLKIVRYYATNLRSLIAIEDIYSDIYIISCEDRDMFIKEVNLRRKVIEAKSSI